MYASLKIVNLPAGSKWPDWGQMSTGLAGPGLAIQLINGPGWARPKIQWTGPG